MNSRRKVLPGMYIEPYTVVTEKGTVEFDMSGTKGPVILSIHGGIGGAHQARFLKNRLDSNAHPPLSPSKPGEMRTASGKWEAVCPLARPVDPASDTLPD